MPTLYDSVGVEPTYELAESIIKAIIQEIKKDSSFYNAYPSSASYAEFSLESLGYRFVSSLNSNKRSDKASAIELIIKHFPDVLKKSSNTLYVKESDKHLLNANDLLVMEFYLLMLNQYEERVDIYQRYLKKQQNRQKYKLLFVLFIPFILILCMFLVGD